MLRRLTKYGESVLKAKAAKVESFDEELENLGKDLVETLYEENGLGLAAPQIDVSKRVFAIDMRRRANPDAPCVFTLDGQKLPLDLAMPLVAVNPEVEQLGDYVEIAEEGCLSFPGVFAEVERSEIVRLKYFDTKGAPHEIVCEGLFARCVQHENDHLDGVCFIDRLTPRQLFQIKPKLERVRRATRDFLKSQKKK
ncbi:MAG: peptide deformylase [Opitutales bacterium]|nr:peptide deformylase [Opitutales bacterium]